MLGEALRASVFGESHGNAIGVVIEGLPAGERIDADELRAFTDRRRPGKNRMSTSRSETDEPEFLSGVIDGVIEGTPVCAVIRNSDQHSGDYGALRDTPRPGHADYTARVKWGGSADMRGGGHFSGRLTAPLCVAGGIAKQLLERRGIYIGSHVASLAGIPDAPFPMKPGAELFASLAAMELPVIDAAAGERMRAATESARMSLDSVGGVVECAVTGLPAGVGGADFGGLESRLAAALFGIPAVKGVEFGLGFALTSLRGSESNDAFRMDGGAVVTETNNCGGILGGISDGMPVVFRAGFKPTPSIAREQLTVNLATGEDAAIEIKGRHDPCVVVRAAPVVEAAAAFVMLDILIGEGKY